MQISMQLKAPSKFFAESLCELFRYIKCNFPGEKAIRVGENKSPWNPIVNAVVAPVDKRSSYEETARFMATTSPITKVFEEIDVRVRAATKTLLVEVEHSQFAALLNLNSAYDDRTRIARSGRYLFLGPKHLEQQCWQNDFDTISLDMSLGFCLIAAEKAQASVFACPCFQMNVYYSAAEKHVDKDPSKALVCGIMLFHLPPLMYLLRMLFFSAYEASLFSQHCATYSTNHDNDDYIALADIPLWGF